MTANTLVGVSAMGAEVPNSRWPSPAAPENTYRDIESWNTDNLAVNTTNLGPTRPRYPVSPVSQVSQALISDISPITPSSPSSYSTRDPFTVSKPVPAPTTISSPPEWGTALSIAGSEIRVVRIPPRTSRASATGSSSGAWRPGSSRTMSSLELRPPSPSSLGGSSLRQTSALDADSGGYTAYHPSLGKRGSNVSVGGNSVASNETLSPDSISWPMPPSRQGESPDRR